MLCYISKPSQITVIRGLYSTLKEVAERGNAIYKYDEDRPLLAALAKSDERGPHEVIYDALPGFVSQISLPEKRKPTPPLAPINVFTDANGPYKDGTIRSFRVGGWICNCHAWNDLVEFASQILYLEHQQDFERCVLNLGSVLVLRCSFMALLADRFFETRPAY